VGKKMPPHYLTLLDGLTADRWGLTPPTTLSNCPVVGDYIVLYIFVKVNGLTKNRYGQLLKT